MKYNMLTVECEGIGKNRFNQTLWLCRCDCGTPCVSQASLVRNGRTKSCGCLRSAGNNRTHGQSGGVRSKAYSTWRNMKSRCDNKNVPEWKDYGGRGITYDPRWAAFEVFLADMGAPPPGLSIDRIDNDKGYFKANCRWANKSTQRRNNTRPMVWVDIAGERLILTDAVKKYGVVPFKTAYQRIYQGWEINKAITTPYTRRFAHTPEAGRKYEHDGRSLTLAEWSRETGIGRVTLLKRIQRGVPVAIALSKRGFLRMPRPTDRAVAARIS